MAGKRKKVEGMTALERAKAFQEDRDQFQVGEVIGLDDDKVHYWFCPHEVGDVRARGVRNELKARGYDPAPDDIYIFGVEGAEVWTTTREVAEFNFSQRVKKNAERRKEIRGDRRGGVGNQAGGMRPAIN